MLVFERRKLRIPVQVPLKKLAKELGDASALKIYQVDHLFHCRSEYCGTTSKITA